MSSIARPKFRDGVYAYNKKNLIYSISPGDKNMEHFGGNGGTAKKCKVKCQEQHIKSPTPHLLR